MNRKQSFDIMENTKQDYTIVKTNIKQVKTNTVEAKNTNCDIPDCPNPACF